MITLLQTAAKMNYKEQLCLLIEEAGGEMLHTVNNHKMCTVEPVYYGHLGTNQKCPDYQGVLIFQVSLCTKGLLWDLNQVCGLCRCPH